MVKTNDTRPFIVIAAIIAALLVIALMKAQGDFGSFGITVMSGLFQGMLLFLVASGLSIIFGLMDVLTLAQGAYFMVGAYVAYDIQHPGGVIDLTTVIPNGDIRFVIAILGAVAVGALLGAVVERVLLRPLYARPIFQLVLTFGLSLVLLELIKLIWTTTPYSWTASFTAREGFFVIFGQQFSVYRLFVIGMGFLLIVGIALLLNRTRIGIIIRAGVEDSEMVEALGINVRMVFTLVFTLGCAVAAFGGAVAAPFLGAAPSLGTTFLLSAIAVVVLGGMGSYVGTAAGSILVGLSVSVAQQVAIGTDFSFLPSITPMLLLVLVLLLRPGGLFGSVQS